jgi:hypothetical protein
MRIEAVLPLVLLGCRRGDEPDTGGETGPDSSLDSETAEDTDTGPGPETGVDPAEITLTPGLPSGQRAGTPVVWTATPATPGTWRYAFSVARDADPARVVRGRDDSATFTWVPLDEATYTISVTATSEDGETTLSGAAAFDAVAATNGDAPALWVTGHPLVGLLGVPACTQDTFLARFRPTGTSGDWVDSLPRPCRGTGGAALWVAGLRPETSYDVQPVYVTGDTEVTGDTLTFETGAVDRALPTMSVTRGTTSATSQEPFTLWSAVLSTDSDGIPIPMATDLEGDVVWYYQDPTGADDLSVLTTRTSEGGFLLLVADATLDQGQYLREVDPAGNPVREVSIGAVKEQLAALGIDEAIGAFDHEAILFPNGQTLVQLSAERWIDTGLGDGRDVLGTVLAALDEDWQVVWAWSSFTHLDTERSSTLPLEYCLDNAPGCPPLYLDSYAEDWIHGNAIAYSPADGNLTYSLRNQDWILKIDYADGAGSGDLVWTLGVDGDFSVTGGDYEYPWFSHQHGANFVDDGTLAVFDNGNSRCFEHPMDCESRGMVLELDEVGMSASVELSAELGAFSIALGMAQRLGNGDYVFTNGALIVDELEMAQSIEVVPDSSTGTLDHTVQISGGSAYRSYRIAGF